MKYFLCPMLVFLLSSCQIETTTWINEDGSGKQEVSVDLSHQRRLTKLAGEKKTTAEEGRSKLEEGLTYGAFLRSPDQYGPLDTTIILYDRLTAEMKSETTAALTKNTYERMINQGKVQSYTMGISYQNIEELIAIQKASKYFLKKLNEEAESKEEKYAIPAHFTTDFIVDHAKGTLIIPANEMDEERVKEMTQDTTLLNDPKTKFLIKTLFKSAGLTETYHMPGEIQFCNNPSARIAGNSISFFYPFVELMDEKEKIIAERIIKYKPK